METLFPFGFPLPTAFYTALYVLTWTVHALLMCYVLAGGAYLAGWALIRLRSGAGREDPLAAVLRDWLPAALGAAITAGVAPLLFLQILHKESFYTANLLLLHRWMAVVPVLIVGFYLLYIAKSKRLDIGSAGARAATTVLAFLSLLFVAYSWTENHLLALDRAAWTDFYASHRLAYFDHALLPRAAVWLFLAFPVMVTLTAWQLRGKRADHLGGWVAFLALAGLAIATLCAFAYHRSIPEPARQLLAGPMARPYLVIAGIGVLLQIGAWAWQWQARRLATAALASATIGAVLTLLGAAVAREAIRLAATDLPRAFAAHERAWEVGGMPVFLIFLLIGGALITWCISIARRGLRGTATQPRR